MATVVDEEMFAGMRCGAFGKSRLEEDDGEFLWPLCRLWVLRILLRLNAHEELIRLCRYADEKMASALCLPRPERGDTETDFRHRAILKLKILLRQEEKKGVEARMPKRITKNLGHLSSWLELGEVEQQILLFTLSMKENYILNTACSYLDRMSTFRIHGVLSAILGIPPAEIRQALSPNSTLLRSSLLLLDLHHYSLDKSIKPLGRSLSGLLYDEIRKPEDILRGLLQSPDAPHLERNHFPHLEPFLQILYPHLERALEEGRSGVNILLHGPPGTGKTQLTRVLARDLGCNLYEVPVEDDDGDVVLGHDRVRTYNAALSLLARGRNLLVFDEMEDLFTLNSTLLSPFPESAIQNKGWFNHALESNPLPTFWISNSVAEVDAAILRRFDMVIEVPVPPASQRERLLRTEAPECIPENAIRRLAHIETLSPAVAARAMRVVEGVSDRLPDGTLPDAIENLIDGTLRAQGYPGLAHYDYLEPPRGYDPALSNTAEDLASLCEGVRRTRQAHLCLYGPPGTGKSAFARYLANLLDAPLLLRRASDLLSPFVGMTEQQIADAFQQARRDKAVLLIDEADNFLRDRRGAQYSWEITQVNEMLTQMEAFDGVFIVSTNLMENLDRAALRRFDAKIYFDYLRPEQAWTLLCRTCKQLSLGKPAAKLRRRLEDLNTLTPGDFATVSRRHRLRPFSTPRNLVDALEQECAFKEEQRKSPMGFVW